MLLPRYALARSEANELVRMLLELRDSLQHLALDPIEKGKVPPLNRRTESSPSEQAYVGWIDKSVRKNARITIVR